MLRLIIACSAAFLLGGLTGGVFVDAINRGTEESYALFSYRDAERRAEAARRFAELVATAPSHREAFAAYAAETGSTPFREEGFDVAGDLAVRFAADRIVEVCFSLSTDPRDETCLSGDLFEQWETSR